jgi:alpha-tubulin suppressor-like RCC1 family protein
MIKKNPIKVIFILLILSVLVSFIISGRAACIGGKRGTRVGSSSDNPFLINAPSNLTATAISFYQIDLLWTDNSNNEDGFEIERSTDGVNYALLSTLNANTTNYSDTTLSPPSLTYYYRVRAFNTIGDRSDWSNEVNTITFNQEWVPTSWSRVSAGDYHTIALATNGTLWTWGLNLVGQLGIGNTYDCILPVSIGTDTDWSEISCGEVHTLGLKSNRTLWSWGGNGAGQLGMGDTESQNWEPFQIGTDSDWLRIAAGNAHNLALKTNGTIWSWGSNTWGELGVGDTNDKFSPTLVGTDSDWSRITAGNAHSLAIKTNGMLWGWGFNISGQLGLGDTADWQILTPTQIGTMTDWSMVTVGTDYTIGIKTNGTMLVTGNNDYGQLGLGDNIGRNTLTQINSDSDWVMSEGGKRNNPAAMATIAIKTNGSLWSWGDNQFGQLGLGDTIERNTPTQIGTASDWSFIGGFFAQTVTIKTNGSLWVWGQNSAYQLGLGDTINRDIPYPLGSPSPPLYLLLIIISSSQITLCWTDISINESGFKVERKFGSTGTYQEIGTTNSNVNSYVDSGIFPPVSIYYRVRSYNKYGDSPYSNEKKVILSGDWFKIVSGLAHTIGLKTNRTLWAWGQNGYGQLGDETTTNRNSPREIGINSDWSAIAAGDSYTIAIKTNPAGGGTLWSWGYNNVDTRLGLGDTINRTTPSQIGNNSDWLMVEAGDTHAIALKTNKTIWVWGVNSLGQLGLGDTNNRNTPTQIIIGTDSDWSTVAAGYYYTIALKTTGTIWSWGTNGSGQLGLGDNTQRNTPSQIGTDSNWFMIAAGKQHTLVLKTDYTIWSWGYNAFGQLGLDDTTQRNTPTQIGTNSDWSVIATGYSHSLGIKTNGSIWAWGYNNKGQLGLVDYGSATNRKTPTQIEMDSNWQGITGGNAHTISIKVNGTLWSWGYNNYGQLGLGDTINRTVPTLVGE